MEVQNDVVVQVRNLVKDYPGVRAVDGISFEVRRREIFGMVGPNGAGKTTTIECIEGFRQPDSGHIQVFGQDPRLEGRGLRQRIGVQFQSAALPDRIKVWEALDLFASFYQRSVDWELMLEQMGLVDKRNAFFSKLSGGQKQRVFIALALVNNPDLVFLDELTTGLDPHARRKMWKQVLAIRDRGKTVFLTTHFMEEAERLCDRVAIIDRGVIVALDSPQNLIRSIGDVNRVIFETPRVVDLVLFKSIPGVKRAVDEDGCIIVTVGKEGKISEVIKALETHNVRYTNLRVEHQTLEDVFLELTGHEIRS
jgi:ABC-2 type transport system ATP-binding protein